MRAARRARLFRAVTVAVLIPLACRGASPVLSFIDDESGLSFKHPPSWQVGVAAQNGSRYRYVTAPNLQGDPLPLSVTFISPTLAANADAVAQPYLAGASAIVVVAGSGTAREWTFKDPSGASSRLRVSSAAGGVFVGGWVRGSEPGLKRAAPQLDALLQSITLESPAAWPEDRYASLVARLPADWIRGSRLSNATNASMQYKSPPFAVEKGTATVHAFVTLTKEPIPPPGDLTAFSKLVRERSSDTAVVLDHQTWDASSNGLPSGFADYLRSGNAVSSTRLRRFMTARNGVGVMLLCEARSDIIDRVDPWCRRIATTVRLE